MARLKCFECFSKITILIGLKQKAAISRNRPSVRHRSIYIYVHIYKWRLQLTKWQMYAKENTDICAHKHNPLIAIAKMCFRANRFSHLSIDFWNMFIWMWMAVERGGWAVRHVETFAWFALLGCILAERLANSMVETLALGKHSIVVEESATDCCRCGIVLALLSPFYISHFPFSTSNENETFISMLDSARNVQKLRMYTKITSKYTWNSSPRYR